MQLIDDNEWPSRTNRVADKPSWSPLDPEDARSGHITKHNTGKIKNEQTAVVVVVVVG